MSDPVFWHRLQFGFTATYHYLFPQLTMGLALIIVAAQGSGPAVSVTSATRTPRRFWIRIFGISFAVGVVTGIPMEFQFGTNWARFVRPAGGVIGQTLAMEGLFAFFLESASSVFALGREPASAAAVTSCAAWALFSGLAGSPAISSSPPTLSCSTRSVYRVAADGTLQLATSAPICSIPGPSSSTCTT